MNYLEIISEKYANIVEELNAYLKSLGARIFIKIYFPNSYLNYFPIYNREYCN